MKKISLLLVSFFIISNMYAVDNLDVLDKQSKEFFKAITGLEKDYLEEQINSINSINSTSNSSTVNSNSVNTASVKVEEVVTEEEHEKNIFTHENDMARLTTDFTRTKKLKDIKIKSMYAFNGRNYVVLKLDDEKNASKKEDEATFNIEGRYRVGDSILTHKIVSIGTRTKTVKLYKKLDDEYGYFIYLSNYGISVSDLIKIEKKAQNKAQNNRVKIDKKEIALLTNDKVEVKNKSKKDLSNCLYTVNVSSINVRNQNSLDATILRNLKINDQFTIKNKIDKWVQIDTIYKKISGDVMLVENDRNWVKILDSHILVDDKNCL